MNHLMVDCETLSTDPNALILTCAMVVFDDAKPAFEVDYQSYVRIGMNKYGDKARRFAMDPRTLQWWLKQDERVMQEAFNGIHEPGALIEDLGHAMGKASTIWSYGAAADVVWLEYFLRVYDIICPWTYRQVRCLRTLNALFPGIEVEPTQKHNALSDARAQAETLYRILNHIK